MEDEKLLLKKIDKRESIIISMILAYFFTILVGLGSISSLNTEVERYKKELDTIRVSYTQNNDTINSDTLHKEPEGVNVAPVPEVDSSHMEYRNALDRAKLYAEYGSMSKQEVYDMLCYIGFSESASQYAVDTLFG